MSFYPIVINTIHQLNSGSTNSTLVSWYGIERHYWAYGVGGVFAAASIIWSLIGILLHFLSSDEPPHKNVRKHSIRILWMVPIYAACAWFALAYKEYALYYDVFRETYEAVTIYSFFALLIAFYGGKVKLIRQLALKVQEDHIAPVSWVCSPWLMGHEFYTYNRFGILQYVVIRILCAFATFVCQFYDLYQDGIFSYTVAYPYIAFVNNASQIWAMYCLILFYIAIHNDIASINPAYKFLCVKAVVFFTFWQGIAVSGLVYIDVIRAVEDYTADEAAAGLENFIICIEMFFAAWAHWREFPVGQLAKENEVQLKLGIFSMSREVELPVTPANSERRTWRMFSTEDM